VPVSDTDASQWKDDYESTGGRGTNAPADGAGNIAALLDDHMRAIKGAVRRQSLLKPWIRLAEPATKSGGLGIAFGVPAGNISAFFPAGRRVKLVVPGVGTGYAYVVAGGFGEETLVELAFERKRPAFTRVDINTITVTGDVRALQPTNSVVLFMATTTGATGFTHRKFTRIVASSSYSSGTNLTTFVFDDTIDAPGPDDMAPFTILTGDQPWIYDNPLAALAPVDATPIAVSVGLFEPGFPSGHPVIARSGSALLPGNASTGPFEVVLDSPLPDADYLPRLQVTAGPASVGTPVERWFPYVSARTTTTFEISLCDALALGETLTIDWLILR
jgi:hypothetical protein